ncbi:MAG: ribosome biogenesis GTP-binding protein YihA/YsxC [Marinilabiliales bacterium]
MKIHSAEFVKSSVKTGECPQGNKHEYAFIGRSNVGKSSLINMLLQRKKIAKTSSTPGKTKLINHFLINDSWYIADLPGYGYAKVSKTEREKWEKMIEHYIINRTNLMCLFLLIDARHEPLKSDIDFMLWLGNNNIPFAIVFTKIDKLSSNQLNKKINTYIKKLGQFWEPLPDYFLTSAVTATGRDEILDYIDNINKTVEI